MKGGVVDVTSLRCPHLCLFHLSMACCSKFWRSVLALSKQLGAAKGSAHLVFGSPFMHVESLNRVSRLRYRRSPGQRIVYILYV